ncbi:ImmA/IrrE family metallo-endopeptidase [Kyrpidia spormannii]|uniref:IrrE N-terminal-like domain-containing protein n=1 Tax=Kyrpidia spormannii TaxID=2055160 RepID=A0A6F9EIP3_9BACL|nr:ImmA/IrrE family metallo-endopeptidase [Kyrpidia spormannii]CAB3396215.1 conserved protein of unknown function [Kyrpidia spormannii]
MADVSLWLEDFNDLESRLGERVDYLFEEMDVPDSPSESRAIAAAEKAREKLGLKKKEAVRDIVGLLESAGIKVYSIICASDGFFGLSVAQEDGGPAIVVNAWDRISVERRIFSAAHELGHLLLHL